MDVPTQEALIARAGARGYLTVSEEAGRVTYHCRRDLSQVWADPEERVRAAIYAWLILDLEYPANRIDIEVLVPRRTPSDYADLVLYQDDSCRVPYLVVECKARTASPTELDQGTEQAFGNANSLRTTRYCLLDSLDESRLFDVANFPPTERVANRLGGRDALPPTYGVARTFRLVAGGSPDIAPASPSDLENAVRRAHALIWAGGKRDPLTAFDEWSKILFAKIYDERHTPNGQPRQVQVGIAETDTSLANRVHRRYEEARIGDPTIFVDPIRLPDDKLRSVVAAIEEVSFTGTSIDALGAAFESFFGSIFRGELGQYFTRRELARFVVAMVDPSDTLKILDPTAGSGGFLLEGLTHVWRRIDRDYAGQEEQDRRKYDFAHDRVFGIEIQDVLGRVCQTNLFIHKDGHTHIEVGRSCLDRTFARPGLVPGTFDIVVGNPPFGDSIKQGDTDQLGSAQLTDFELARGRPSVDSEIAIIERAIQFLRPGGVLGFVVPDGLLNNAGEQSNCPAFRRFLICQGRILAVVSLPDFAFRKAGAQNKTSLLFFQKFSDYDRGIVSTIAAAVEEWGTNEGLSETEIDELTACETLRSMPYRLFAAEAEFIGYTPAGAISDRNDLYKASDHHAEPGEGTILGEYREFRTRPNSYVGRERPDCVAMDAVELFLAHASHRFDPKYHLFQRHRVAAPPPGMSKYTLGELLTTRADPVDPSQSPDVEFKTMTVRQTGQIAQRQAGVGRNPPAWFGAYFKSNDWNRVRAGDLIYSRIDLWKGCVSVIPGSFDGAIATKEFPAYEVDAERLRPHYLRLLLRSPYFRRAIRAITTGHSNRRRTSDDDFLTLEVFLPPPTVQDKIVDRVLEQETRIREDGHEYDQLLAEVEELMMGKVEVSQAIDVLEGRRPLPDVSPDAVAKADLEAEAEQLAEPSEASEDEAD